MSEFILFRNAVKENIDKLVEGNILLFSSTIPKSALCNAYLNGFPVLISEIKRIKECDDVFMRAPDELPENRGVYARVSNPIYRIRTVHDCATCLRFIGSVGKILYYNKETGDVKSIWDDIYIPDEYKSSVAAMLRVLKFYPVGGVFRAVNKEIGALASKESVNGVVHEYNHFFSEIPEIYRRSTLRATINDVLPGIEKVVTTVSEENVSDVLTLISEGLITRGSEYLPSIEGVRDMLKLYNASGIEHIETYSRTLLTRAFSQSGNIGDIAKYRFNSPACILLFRIADGCDEETAVAKYEDMVRADNYRVSKSGPSAYQAKKAIERLDELGLRDSLARRHAIPSDINPSDVIYINRSTRDTGADPLADMLSDSIVHRERKVTEAKNGLGITIDELKDMVPNILSLEVYVVDNLLDNAVTLIAPKGENVKPLTDWDNNFSLTYNGNYSDILVRRINKEGGTVNAALRYTGAWHTTDDYDIWCKMPNGNIINFDRPGSINGRRILEIDKNAPNTPMTTKPVENIVFPLGSSLPDGDYIFGVHNFEKHNDNPENPKSEYSFLCGDKTVTTQLNRQLDHKESKIIFYASLMDNKVVKFTVPDGFTIYNSMDEWGVKVGTYVPVSMLFLSPNYWESGNDKGTLHHVFALKDMKFPGKVRGFLPSNSTKLRSERKALEVLSSKMLCEPSHEQLTGFGFSSSTAKKDKKTLSVRVTTETGKQNYTVSF